MAGAANGTVDRSGRKLIKEALKSLTTVIENNASKVYKSALFAYLGQNLLCDAKTEGLYF